MKDDQTKNQYDDDLDLSGIIPRKKGDPVYAIRELRDYCEENGIEFPLPDDSPIWDQFLIGKI